LANAGISLSLIIFGLLLINTVFNFSTFIGVIATTGIVINNGLLMITFYNKMHRRESRLKGNDHSVYHTRQTDTRYNDDNVS